ncbi:MAG: hypothetical protein Q8K75_03315 [Chlamydiales bacterium]|nr:hypothetical protein [Chlamydiales bacterium]
MDLKAINRIILLTLMEAVMTLPFIAFFYDLPSAAAVLVGALWGCANMYLLKLLVQSWLTTEQRNYLAVHFLLWFKFPILYLSGYALLKSGIFPSIGLLFGFSLIFVSILVFGGLTMCDQKGNRLA